MSIKRRIVVFQLVVGMAMFAIAALAYTAITVMSDALARVQWSRQQLDATTRLAVLANRYSEQIAETLLIGDPELPDLEDARTGVAASISAAREIAQQEIAALAGPEHAAEAIELERIAAMQVLFRQIDGAVDELLALRNAGRLDEAVTIFRSRIENRLDADFEQLIADAILDEREEAAAVDAEAIALARNLTFGTFIVLALVLGLTMLLAVRFYAGIAAPLQTLTAGTLAIEGGDLTHRLGLDRNDELGQLAQHFDRMAERLEHERGQSLAARADLERQVASRTSELADANRRLREIDRQRVRFLADASHELRTPLTVLRGEAEVALRGSARSDREYRETLELIVEQAADMTRLVEDLLFVARSEADEIRFEFEPLPLDELVDDAVADATVLARGSGMQFSIDVADPAPIVRADPRRLKQALLVVLDNALKYSSRSAGALTNLRVTRADGHALIAVTDDGPGIPADELPYVLNRFYRGEAARAEGIGGSGLGLSIARRIAETHGGSIAVESRPGQGTTVTFRLPMSA